MAVLASELTDLLVEALARRGDFQVTVCDCRTGEDLPITSWAVAPDGRMKLGVRPPPAPTPQ